MANISVASLDFVGSTSMYGQSFTPNVVGPDGVGSVGSATQVALNQITLGYPTPLMSGNSGNMYVFDSPIQDPDDSCSPLGATAVSSSCTDGSAFGTDSYTRTFSFSNETLQVGHTYYFYLPGADDVQYTSPAAYSGGQAIDCEGSPADLSLRFRVDLTV